MSISQTRYVDITSAVVGASSVAEQSFAARIFTPSDALPNDVILSFANAPDVRNYFGDGEEATLATKYFSVTTPAPVSKPKEIQFASHSLEVRNASITGGRLPKTVEAIKTAVSAFSVIITDEFEDETVVTVTPVLTSAVSLTDVASAITTKLQTTNPELLVDFMESFKVSSTVKNVSLRVATGSLAVAMGFGQDDVQEVSTDVQTMVEAYSASIQRNDSFGSCYFLVRGELPEVVQAVELNASQNVKHMMHIQVTRQEKDEFFAAIGETASCSLQLLTPKEQYIAHIPMGLQAAIDYKKPNATMNFMFRQSGVTVESQVTTDLLANDMDASRVNYYGQTAKSGSSIKFYQRGFLCGNPTAPLDMSVHAGEQWLKSRISALWFDLLLGTRGIPNNLDGKGRATQVIAQVVEEAIFNGVISVGSDLTVTQRLAIADATNDDLAYHEVTNTGSWYNAEIVEFTGPSGIAEYQVNYTLVYKKGDWVRKVVGSHNLV